MRLFKRELTEEGCTGRTGGSCWSCPQVGGAWEELQTYLVVELWELHLHLVPLEVVVLGLLAHGGDEVELPRH